MPARLAGKYGADLNLTLRDSTGPCPNAASIATAASSSALCRHRSVPLGNTAEAARWCSHLSRASTDCAGRRNRPAVQSSPVARSMTRPEAPRPHQIKACLV